MELELQKHDILSTGVSAKGTLEVRASKCVHNHQCQQLTISFGDGMIV